MGKVRSKTGDGTTNQNINDLNVNQYWINDQVKKDVTAYNWSYPIGMQTQFYKGKDRILPSVMRLDVQTAMGISNSTKSPAYQNASILYDLIVRMNNANMPYDPVDLQIFVMALGEVWGMWRCLQRIYKVSNTYDPLNVTMPKVILDALGIDINEIRKRKVEFRAWINDYAIRMTNLSFPVDIDLFARKDELYLGLYGDENSDKAQFYLFNPVCFYQLDETDPSGTTLKPRPYWCTPNTASTVMDSHEQFAEGTPGTPAPSWIYDETGAEAGHSMLDRLMNIADDMMNALAGSSDVRRITADLRHAYSNFQTVDMLTEDAVVGRWHNYAMLTQIENARIIPQARQVLTQDGGNAVSIGYYFPYISQNPNINQGYLTFSYTGIPLSIYEQSSSAIYSNLTNDEKDAFMGVLREAYSYPKMLNVHSSEAPGADATMLMTRLLPTVSSDGEYLTVEQCGTEFIVAARMFFMTADGSTSRTGTVEYASVVNMSRNTTNATTASGPVKVRSAYIADQFAFAPQRLILDATNTRQASNMLVLEHFDIDQFAFADNDSLNLLHYNALLGQFRAPGYSYNSSSRKTN